MPCWTRTLATMDMGKVDMQSLYAALQDLGLDPVLETNAIYFRRGSYDRTTGKLELQGISNAQAWTKDLKQRVAVKNVQQQARRMGWKFKLTSPTQIQLTK